MDAERRARKLLTEEVVALWLARLHAGNPDRRARFLAEYETAHEALLALRAEHPTLTLGNLALPEAPTGEA